MTGPLTDIYIIATAIGSMYLIITVVMGQLHVSGGHGHDAGGHHGHGDHGHSDLSQGDSHADCGGDEVPRLNVVRHVGKVALASMLSPMTISMFCAFFGLTGLVFARSFPFLGPLTLLPAITAGVLISAVMMRIFSWAFAKCNVSANARTEELVGQIAEVCVPIKEGRKGEITCVLAAKRFNYPAKSASLHLTSGQKVIISDYNDGIVTVEPFEDYTLDISSSDKVSRKIEQ